MANISPAQLDVLRKLVKDPNFRQSFATDPVKAVSQSGVKLSDAELNALKKITPQQLNQFKAKPSPDGNGTHTLLYAVAIATLIA